MAFCRGILSPPFHLRPTPPPLRWLTKVTRYRFFCTHTPQAIDLSSNYTLSFAKRMSMAGLKPHHRIVLAVSGGPDSVALCVLTARWKSGSKNAAACERTKPIDGLLAVVVDHGLRAESTEEANIVRNRIVDMGIRCELAHCEWLEGRPQPGQLQEAARNKRYDALLKICMQQQIATLLVAHHSDDQAELFIIRLSRNSGVLGLAGMASASQIFPDVPDCSGYGSKPHGILLVRPLLEFSKEDVYNICRSSNQPWVEDPTNKSQLYTRNRIRLSLNNLSSSKLFKTELQAVISTCRRTRLYVDQLSLQLLSQAVTILPYGYAVIDLANLHTGEVKDLVLAKFIALVVQFISQKHRPIRGNAQKLLLHYLRTFPCKSSLTVASCYLCPAPGSKGTKVLVCCSVHPSSPPKMKSFPPHYKGRQSSLVTNELQQIITDSEAYLNKSIPDASSVPFLDLTSSESVLNGAKRLGILSDSSSKTILSLQQDESGVFKFKAEITSEHETVDCVSGVTKKKLLYPGQAAYFMDRFILNWKAFTVDSNYILPVSEIMSAEGLRAEEQSFCCSCVIGDEKVAEVRHMVDADWLYLSNLSNNKCEEGSSITTKQMAEKTVSCLDHAVSSACRALLSLKSIPVAARRPLPVIVNSKGILLSIPSLGFSHCPRLRISAEFNPRIPLGGGHSSFL